MIRRDAEGWRTLGPLMFRVEREDNHGDRSTTTTISVTWIARWSIKVASTRPWVAWEEAE